MRVLAACNSSAPCTMSNGLCRKGWLPAQHQHSEGTGRDALCSGVARLSFSVIVPLDLFCPSSRDVQRGSWG